MNTEHGWFCRDDPRAGSDHQMDLQDDMSAQERVPDCLCGECPDTPTISVCCQTDEKANQTCSGNCLTSLDFHFYLKQHCR